MIDELTGKNRVSEIDVLKFIWKWRLLSTNALQRRFYSEFSHVTAYKRILALQKCGWIENQYLPSLQGFAWKLTKSGFRLISDELNELAEFGFKSEAPLHDFIVTAIQLGEGVGGSRDSANDFTEHELRRYHKDVYPSWVPTTDDHRPDGYKRIVANDGEKILALEVERSLKAKGTYQSVADFYDYNSNIDTVAWCVSSISMGNTIFSHLKTSYAENTGAHNFFLIRDFKKHGWAAEAYLGKRKGTSFRNICQTNAEQTPDCSSQKVLWNLKKRSFY